MGWSEKMKVRVVTMKDDGINLVASQRTRGRIKVAGQLGPENMKEGKMGMKVKNGARRRWSCAWDFMHVKE